MHFAVDILKSTRMNMAQCVYNVKIGEMSVEIWSSNIAGSASSKRANPPFSGKYFWHVTVQTQFNYDHWRYKTSRFYASRSAQFQRKPLVCAVSSSAAIAAASEQPSLILSSNGFCGLATAHQRIRRAFLNTWHSALLSTCNSWSLAILIAVSGQDRMCGFASSPFKGACIPSCLFEVKG